MIMEKWKLRNGFELPKIGLGTWLYGGTTESDTSHDAEDTRAIAEAISLGYTHIDTAEMYGAGHCEELVGKVLENFDRQKIMIATKVLRSHLGRHDVIRAARQSLGRLGVEYIDLYYIHAPNPEIPIQETMQALDELVSEGVVRNIGVSNFTVELMKEAQSYTSNKIVANQVEYSLLTRESGRYSGNSHMESKTLRYCQDNDIIVVAERPLERGVILQQNLLMDTMVNKYNKTYSQIALNWLVSQTNVVTIPMSKNIEHLKENLGALGWQMEVEDIERLRSHYPSVVQ